MSAPVQGHGYREDLAIRPKCKCGWAGSVTHDPEVARRQFEAHKTKVRHELGLEAPAAVGESRHPAGRGLPPHRGLRLVKP